MSIDIFLGLPFNIASYALLTHIIAEICNIQVGTLTFMGGDLHIYSNHEEPVRRMLNNQSHGAPTLVLPKGITTLEDAINAPANEFILLNYKNSGVVSAQMAV